jgi:hypothetical protein
MLCRPSATDANTSEHVFCVQNFREPLYLKDKPVRVEDTRSEEERKYPELFRQKLQGAPGPRHVRAHIHHVEVDRQTDVRRSASPASFSALHLQGKAGLCLSHRARFPFRGTTCHRARVIGICDQNAKRTQAARHYITSRQCPETMACCRWNNQIEACTCTSQHRSLHAASEAIWDPRTSYCSYTQRCNWSWCNLDQGGFARTSAARWLAGG